MKTAVVIGATGLTGRGIVKTLIESDRYDEVVSFSRRPLRIHHEKLKSHIVDFENFEGWKAEVQGDDLFCALGTTLKQAGSKAAQYKIDYHYQAMIIEQAKINDISRLFLVSSPGANPKSMGFYLRMKGELDEFAKAQKFQACVLIKPSVIIGNRPDNRIGEKVGAKIFNVVSRLSPSLEKFKPVMGEVLGKQIVHCAENLPDKGEFELTYDEIENCANQ